MPGTLVDLGVAARLALRAAARRLRGEMEPAPDLAAFRGALEPALAKLESDVVAEHVWIELPANEPPWRNTGIALRAGEEVSWFAAGRTTLSKALDVYVGPKTQLWARIGEAGPVRSSSRDSGTLRAERDGAFELGNWFPNSWKDPSGARAEPDSVYASLTGRIGVLVVRWRAGAAEGLAALAAAGDPLGVFASERDRHAQGDPAPPGWHYLWHIGDAEAFRPARGPAGDPALSCETHEDASILQRDAAFPLRPGTEIAWRWRVEALPGVAREDSIPSHDYLSLAVEFQNGLDLTYYWSPFLPEGTAFWCPLPAWKTREFHVVIRSGRTGLGAWRAERRDLHADALRYLGSHPGDVVRVWLIAVSAFQRQRGSCQYAEIRLHGDGRELAVL
jgi:hypothetical protein